MSKQTKVIPEPWIMTENGANGFITVEGANRAVVVQYDLGSIPDEASSKDGMAEEMLATAIFIQHAPEMFAALKEKAGADCTCQSHGTCWHCRARDILAKAKGN